MWVWTQRCNALQMKKMMEPKGNANIQKSFGGFLFNGTHEINMPHKCRAV